MQATVAFVWVGVVALEGRDGGVGGGGGGSKIADPQMANIQPDCCSL